MQPLLSIITVTHNCTDVIARTLDSVLKNKPEGLEYIIIDGASTDSTLEKMTPWRDEIDLLISEQDSGIYDAMNKGIQKANGIFILFLNAGDELYSTSTLPSIFSLINKNSPADILYGDTMLVDGSGKELGLRSEISSRKLPRQLNWKSLKRGMVVSHQSFIVRKEISPIYDLKYHSSADIDWVIKCLKNANNIVNSELIISRYLTGGFSKQRPALSLKERFLILQHHYGVIPNLVNHLTIILRGLTFRIRGKALN